MAEITTENKSGAVDLQRPFQGLLAFGEKNKSQFGGRDVEINELFLLTRKNPLTIVFGKSGIGKTSVLQAGLMPELQKKSFLPIYFRIDFANAKSPLIQLKDFIYEKLKSFDPATAEFGNKTLWEYFHDIQLADGKVLPVLILDQFEETFTIGKDKGSEVTELITELSDLAENRVPVAVYAEYQKRDELLPSHYERQPYRVIIGLREDYLAQLESLKKYLPSIQKSRCRILQMTALQAMQSVLKSAGNLIEKDVAKEIIKKLPGVTERDFDELADDSDHVKRLLIEPFLLSLICFQINEKRIERGLEKFTHELVAEFEIKDVISSFYNDALKNCNENVPTGIEDSLLTESGYRKLASIEELETKYQIDAASVEILISKRLIRKEERDGVDYVELIHDVLVPVIKEKKEIRIKERLEKERQEAIHKANEINKLKIKKIKKRGIIAGIIALVVFSLISVYASQQANEASRLKNIEYARKLLIASNNAANNLDFDIAAYISRAAYLFYKENKGNDFRNFYTDMFNKLKLVDFKNNTVEYGDESHIPWVFDSCFVFSIAGTNSANSDNHKNSFKARNQTNSVELLNEYVYSGYFDGKLLKTKWTDSIVQPEILFDFKKYPPVTNEDPYVKKISASMDNNFLAVGGGFPFVHLFDLHKKTNKSLKMPVVREYTISVLFADNGNLLVLTDSALAGWNNIGFQESIIWNKKKQFNFEDGKLVSLDTIHHDLQIKWDLNSLSIPGVKFNCMTVFKDMIAIGIDSGLVLVKKDSLIKVISPGIGISTSIQFDTRGKYLYIGSEEGKLSRLKLTDFSIDICQNQSKQINSIVCNTDGSFIATASRDGSIGIYNSNKEEEWKYSTPIILSLPDPCVTESKPYPISVAFSKDNKYLLAGFDNGAIYKWPVNADVLADMICARITLSSDSLWKKYVDNRSSQIELNRYACKQINKK